ncbi:MAG: hypothetical protein KBT32_00040 [Bacteroidales bacterium]|nr:hypothetical protein [Candidatus Physcocola equi]
MHRKSILHQIDLMLPHGDTISVSVRKAYFGEVMAKVDLADCIKLTVEDSGKRSYEPFKREIDK